MRLSIIISTWNSLSYLKPCLESIECLYHCEIVIVDSGSEDGTREYLKTRLDLIAVSFPRKMDWAYANEIGLQMSHGDWICLSNPDVLFNKDFLKLLDYCENTDAEVIVPQLIYPDGRPQGPQHLTTPREIMARTRTAEFFNKVLRGRTPQHGIVYRETEPFRIENPVGSLFLVSRKVLNRLDGRLWHPGYKIGVADSDAFMNFKANNVRMELFPGCRIIHFVGHRTSEPSWIEYDTAYGTTLYLRYWKMWPRLMTVIFLLESVSAFMVDVLVKLVKPHSQVSPMTRLGRIGLRFKGIIDGWRYRI